MLGDLGREGSNGHMAMPTEDQVAVDLIGADHQVVVQANLGQSGQLVSLVHPTYGVVWVAEQEETGSLQDCGFELVHVDLVSLALQVNLRALERAAGVRRRRQAGGIYRRLDQNAVTRLANGAAGDVETSDHAWQKQDVVNGYLPAVQGFQAGLDGLTQCARIGRVAKDAVRDALLESPDHWLW
jgi:hypothetical protein